MKTAQDVLRLSFPGFHWPLEIARGWVRGSDAALRQQGRHLLEALREKYPHAPQIGPEYILALIECGEGDEVVQREIEVVQKAFELPDEEYYCRLGRIYKEQGDRSARHMAVESARMAVRYYELALHAYEAAWNVKQGQYPAINCATLFLILASLQDEHRERSLLQSREWAQRVLDSRPWIRIFSDDNIWHLATEAEACTLLGQTAEAADLYRRAVREWNSESFHAHSMYKQLGRILDAFRKLGKGSFHPLEELIPENSCG